jgi:hypothetical protein
MGPGRLSDTEREKLRQAAAAHAAKTAAGEDPFGPAEPEIRTGPLPPEPPPTPEEMPPEPPPPPEEAPPEAPPAPEGAPPAPPMAPRPEPPAPPPAPPLAPLPPEKMPTKPDAPDIGPPADAPDDKLNYDPDTGEHIEGRPDPRGERGGVGPTPADVEAGKAAKAARGEAPAAAAPQAALGPPTGPSPAPAAAPEGGGGERGPVAGGGQAGPGGIKAGRGKAVPRDAEGKCPSGHRASSNNPDACYKDESEDLNLERHFRSKITGLKLLST